MDLKKQKYETTRTYRGTKGKTHSVESSPSCPLIEYRVVPADSGANI
jgi:hypothetical protein